MKKEVFLSGDITRESIYRLMQSIRRVRRDDNNTPITLFICSPGGNRMPAVGFYGWIKAEKIQLHTVAIGDVSSAALYIFLSGIKRKASAYSQFLVHPGGRPLDPVRRFLFKIIFPRRYKEDRDFESGSWQLGGDILKRETKLTPEEIEKYTTKEYLLMTPQKALEKGFISEIV